MSFHCRTLCFLALTLWACKEKDPYYCADAPHHNCLAMIDGSLDCTGNQDCKSPTGVCDLAGSRRCVECTAAEHDACTMTHPVCGDDQACRACAAHAECSSNVCLPDGACGGDTTVAYVDDKGTDNDMCTQAMPCLKVAKALATGRP